MEKHWQARFCEEDIRRIREEVKTTTQAALAKKYGVGKPTIHKIVHRHAWAHVP